MPALHPNSTFRPARAPLGAPFETPRLTLLNGLLDHAGEPMAAIATGHPYCPSLRVYRTFAAALAALAAVQAMRAGRAA